MTITTEAPTMTTKTPEQIADNALDAHRTNSGELNSLIRAAALDAAREAQQPSTDDAYVVVEFDGPNAKFIEIENVSGQGHPDTPAFTRDDHPTLPGVQRIRIPRTVQQAPAFKPNGYDYYREQWGLIEPEHDYLADSFSLQIISSVTAPYGDGSSARTQQIPIRQDQAAHILAYLSESEQVRP